VQAQQLSVEVVIAALPLSLLVAAILYINEFPDYVADKKAGKNTLVVRLGLAQARLIYAILIGLSFITVIVGVIYNSLPWFSLICLLALPIGFFSIKRLYTDYDKPTALIPAIKNTILLHTLVGILLVLVFLYPI
jgi:1,4-dihydroxy-2-naphthoate octaprenyltransferase